MSIQFVSALFVAALCAVNAADLCLDPSKITPNTMMDATTGDYNYYYCQTAVKGKNLEYCKINIHGNEDNTASVNAWYFDASSETPKAEEQKFSLIKQNNGIYDAKEIGTTEAKTYVLDISPDMCMTYMKCFNNGKWAGSDESGAFIGMICPTPEQCTGPASEAMVKNINDNFLPEGVTLEETPRAKCVELGMA